MGSLMRHGASSAKTLSFYLPAGTGRSGQRYCRFHAAADAQGRGSVLYVHPFAEEMNKSRRMATLQARALAEAGFNVLQLDLLGCGDSSGDFGDATWQDWIDDVALGCRWLLQEDDAPLWLWGLRAGCLLAAAAASQLSSPANFVFWAPATSGKLLLQQFLRLKSAASLLAGGTKRQTQEPRQLLTQGEPVDVAGYTIAPGLALGMGAALLAPPIRPVQPWEQTQRLAWLEVSTRPGAELSPVSVKTLEAWENSGIVARSQVVEGPQFWQTTEIELAPAILTATVTVMSNVENKVVP
jgi:uncharacterized protein